MVDKDLGYTRLNAILAKRLGIGDKLADLQMKHDPKDLHDILSVIPTTNERIEDQKPTFEKDGYEVHSFRDGSEEDEGKTSVHFSVDTKMLLNPEKYKRDKERTKGIRIE